MKIFVKVNDTNAMLQIQVLKEDTVFDIIERIQQASEDLDYDFGLHVQWGIYGRAATGDYLPVRRGVDGSSTKTKS